jgi:hypothetical protein
LCHGCINQTGFTKTQRGAPQARHGFDQSITLIVINIDTLTTNDGKRAEVFMTAKIGKRMQDILPIRIG